MRCPLSLSPRCHTDVRPYRVLGHSPSVVEGCWLMESLWMLTEHLMVPWGRHSLGTRCCRVRRPAVSHRISCASCGTSGWDVCQSVKATSRALAAGPGEEELSIPARLGAQSPTAGLPLALLPRRFIVSPVVHEESVGRPHSRLWRRRETQHIDTTLRAWGQRDEDRIEGRMESTGGSGPLRLFAALGQWLLAFKPAPWGGRVAGV